jgi:hypothetical protein
MTPSEATFTSPHPECEEPQLWTAPDAESSEVEVTEFLEALARLVKPRIAVETGTFHGHTTVVLARAVQAAGRGHIYGIELDAGNAAEANRRIGEAGLSQWATVVTASSLEWTPPGPIDLAFLDAGAGWHRATEFQRLRRHMHKGTVVCVHDTARKNRQPRLALEGLAARGLMRPVWIRSPRGLLVAQPAWPSLPRQAVGMPRYAAYRAYAAARAFAASVIRRADALRSSSD